MKTIDLYQKVLSAVCRYTGVIESDIISSNREECVDARYLLVYFLGRFLPDGEIARHSGLTRQAVNYIRNHFEFRRGRWGIKSCLSDLGDEIRRCVSP